MIEVDDINRAVLELFKNHQFPADQKPLWPLLYPPLRRSCLVFVGLNPSFTEGYQEAVDDVLGPGRDARQVFEWPGTGAMNIEIMQKLEAAERRRSAKGGRFGYLKEVGEIAKNAGAGDDWELIDMFYLRVTDQEEFEPQIRRRKNVAIETVADLNEFGRSQFEISMRLLQKLNPGLVVVFNMTASKLLSSTLNAAFTDALGCRIARLNGRMVGLFFWRQITGRWVRPNEFEKERLDWHIRRLYGSLKGSGCG